MGQITDGLSGRCQTSAIVVRDRAAVATTAIGLIIETASPGERLMAIETYLRDEISDIERQVAGDRELPE
jgi:predicted DNA-binding transcriptional regulator